MTFTTKQSFTSLTLAGLLMAAPLTAAIAQTGCADVPTNAKKQGTMTNGASSTGMSKGEAKSGMMKKDGMMKKNGMMKGEGGSMKSGAKM